MPRDVLLVWKAVGIGGMAVWAYHLSNYTGHKHCNYINPRLLDPLTKGRASGHQGSLSDLMISVVVRLPAQEGLSFPDIATGTTSKVVHVSVLLEVQKMTIGCSVAARLV